MKILHAHPNVPFFVKQSALAYYENEVLDKFCTTFICHPDYYLSNAILKFVPQFEKELKRRLCDELPLSKIDTFPFREILRTFASRYANATITDFIWEWAELKFDSRVASFLNSEHSHVHVYEFAALETLKRAKKIGVYSVYEQPSQHHSFFTNIAHQQIKLFPELNSSATSLLIDEKAKRRNKRRDEELMLADTILCNSSFTKSTLVGAGVDDSKIKVVPYGFPTPISKLAEKKSDKPFVFFNAGTQNLRKALHLLYKAWEICDFKPHEAELWLIGKMNLPESLRKNLPGKVVVRDSIPRTELMQIYQEADVFVLPTLADGFGMVISESMANGLPVITTQNSGGPDIIENEKDGIIVEAGNLEALVESMRWSIKNRDKISQMGKVAWEKSKTYQWHDYRKRLISTLEL